MARESVFHRPEYARALAQQLLHPGPLDQHLQSGVFISGIRRIGKTTFIRQDLIPALEEEGALPVYVDLWADRSRPPMGLLQEAIREKATELAEPKSRLMERLRKVKGANFGVLGINLGIQLDGAGTPTDTTLAQIFVEFVRQTGGDVVLVIDEVQQAMSNQDGQDMLFALKAARDRVNTAPDLDGRLLILGTGSHKSLVTDMATRRSQPFAGAHTATFEPLGKDYVEWFLKLANAAGMVSPSVQTAFEGFRGMGSRPEELIKAVRQLQDEVAAGRAADTDNAFATICATLAGAAAEVEMQLIEEAGPLAVLAFSRIAAGQARGLYTADALATFRASLGREVSTNDVTSVINRLIANNLIVRTGRQGEYDAADPFVRQQWLRLMQMRQSLDEGALAPVSVPPGER